MKVGVLTDIAGPTAMANGKGSVIAAEMAAEDFGADLNVEVISADHSGKPDVGSQIAARWFDVGRTIQLGQTRRFDRRPVTSGLPRLTDILGVSRHVSMCQHPTSRS